MFENKKRTFENEEIRWGMIKKFCGVFNGRLVTEFVSYIVFYYDEDGKCVNCVNQDEKYMEIDYKKGLRGLEEGDCFAESASYNADFIMRRISPDYKKFKKYSIHDIEDAIISSDSLFFKDSDRIKQEREKNKIGNIKNKIKKKVKSLY